MMIPSQSYSFSGILVTLFFSFLCTFVLHTLAFPKLHHCRHDQRDALLEIKNEFLSTDMNSWNKSSDCCFWGAVMCDTNGQVISLYLYDVDLNNTLKPNSGLFKLQYLQNLTFRYCNLYGEIPSSFENLSHLTVLDLSFNRFVGQIPTSFGNLSHLTSLDLSMNALVGQVPAFIGNLTKLRHLILANNKFIGKIPVSFANLTKLVTLELTENYFEPQLLPDISRLQNLEDFSVSGNLFCGHFPTSLFTNPSLQWVRLYKNEFKGPIDFGNRSLSSSLWYLDLSDNKFGGLIPESISKFRNLVKLDLSNNNLEGKVPGCLWRLESLKLSHNSFSSFEKSLQVLGQSQMLQLRLDSNSFRGPFLPRICKLRSLEMLDLSNNSFNGSFPSCLRNLSDSLRVLNLGSNNFSGILPDLFVNTTRLSVLDVGDNSLEGKLPKSLINCKNMEFLNVGGNKFKDKFPSWLGSLPSLNVLILRSNQFYGQLYHRDVSIGFQNLKVIDISHNDFTGAFPSFYFFSWREMSTLDGEMSIMSLLELYGTYMGAYRNGTNNVVGEDLDSMEIFYKGVYTKFEGIRTDLKHIDFSRNRFNGKIPESIGLLKGLRSLNLSRNAFTSNIPKSLANLTSLETLDISRNKLFGQIPQDLGILSFLSTMDFSYNNLEGPIPRGTQFERQYCSSFIENPRLYGLEKICGKPHVTNLTPQESEEVTESEEQVINWIAAAIAFGPGVFCGLVIGYIFVSHYHEWFMVTFHRYKRRVVNRGAR